MFGNEVSQRSYFIKIFVWKNIIKWAFPAHVSSLFFATVLLLQHSVTQSSGKAECSAFYTFGHLCSNPSWFTRTQKHACVKCLQLTHMHVYAQTQKAQHTRVHTNTQSLSWHASSWSSETWHWKWSSYFAIVASTHALSLPCIHMFPPVHFYLHVGFASASHPASCCPLLYFYKMMEYQPHLGSINSFFKQHWNKWVPDRGEWEEDWRSRLGLKTRGRWLVR